MSHPLIASLCIACLTCAVPLAAHSAEDIALPAPNPLATFDVAHDGLKMLRIDTRSARSTDRATPVIDVPNFPPKWQHNAVSPDTGTSKLQGDQFKLR